MRAGVELPSQDLMPPPGTGTVHLPDFPRGSLSLAWDILNIGPYRGHRCSARGFLVQ